MGTKHATLGPFTFPTGQITRCGETAEFIRTEFKYFRCGFCARLNNTFVTIFRHRSTVLILLLKCILGFNAGPIRICIYRVHLVRVSLSRRVISIKWKRWGWARMALEFRSLPIIFCLVESRPLILCSQK